VWPLPAFAASSALWALDDEVVEVGPLVILLKLYVLKYQNAHKINLTQQGKLLATIANQLGNA